MPPRRRAKAKAMPRSDQERVRDVPPDELRERQEFGQRPEGEQMRIYHIAGRLSATYSPHNPNFFIPHANRIFREEPDLTAGLLEDFVPAPPGRDHSRSPRVPLSDEARFLQRLAEPELPPGATDAAARGDGRRACGREGGRGGRGRGGGWRVGRGVGACVPGAAPRLATAAHGQ